MVTKNKLGTYLIWRNCLTCKHCYICPVRHLPDMSSSRSRKYSFFVWHITKFMRRTKTLVICKRAERTTNDWNNRNTPLKLSSWIVIDNLIFTLVMCEWMRRSHRYYTCSSGVSSCGEDVSIRKSDDLKTSFTLHFHTDLSQRCFRTVAFIMLFENLIC